MAQVLETFEAFKKTILTKQMWHLLVSPHSLVGQILKSKYFPTSNVLDAKLHNNPSLIWVSFYYSIDLIKEGLLWRIGDGLSVNIQGDNWLLTPNRLKIQSPIQLLDSKAKVACLIDPKTHMWNHPLISQIFTSEEAATIGNIPLSLLEAANKLSWWPAKNGQFSIKSTYALEINRVNRKFGKPRTLQPKKIFGKMCVN